MSSCTHPSRHLSSLVFAEQLTECKSEESYRTMRIYRRFDDASLYEETRSVERRHAYVRASMHERTSAAMVLEACWRDDAAKLRRLLRRGGRSSLKDPVEGKQGTHVAAEANAGRALAVLLEAGADPNAACAYGSRPLHFCCINDAVDCLQMLLDYGANPLAADQRGLTPADHARLLDAHNCLRAMKYRGLVPRRESPSVRRTRKYPVAPRTLPRRRRDSYRWHHHQCLVGGNIYQAHLNGAPLSSQTI